MGMMGFMGWDSSQEALYIRTGWVWDVDHSIIPSAGNISLSRIDSSHHNRAQPMRVRVRESDREELLGNEALF
jgi:hypothetical protein